MTRSAKLRGAQHPGPLRGKLADVTGYLLCPHYTLRQKETTL